MEPTPQVSRSVRLDSFWRINATFHPPPSMLTYHFARERAVRTKEVQFGLLSCEEIRRLAVVEITNVNIYHRGTPQSGAINDLLMGTIDRRLRCQTCLGDVKVCQGHPGIIELGAPVYHIGYVDTTLKVLRSVCYCCGKLLLPEADAEALKNEGLESKLLFNAVYAAARMRKRCLVCYAPQPNYTRVASVIKIDWPECEFEDEHEKQELLKRNFSSIEARSILQSISDCDATLMGFSVQNARPRDMVPTCILVPPPIARPAICQSTGSRIRGQDDITHTLQSILKRALEFKAAAAAEKWTLDLQPSLELLEKLSKMQQEVFALVNNGVRGQRVAIQRSGAPIKSLICRLRGKEGRIRGNLSGKRVDFSARSVVAPDPLMAIDEVGVPESIARELTIPERVTHANISELRERVLKGTHDVGGATALIGKDGTVTQLEFCQNRHALQIEPGAVLERHMKDGDYVVFNRQPSLHKYSMLCHRVKIMPGSCFRLNLSCTSCYNADFDGDEMNLHVLQSPAAQSEGRALLSVPTNIISPQGNKPVIAIVQDALLGSAIMTEYRTLIDREHYMRFLCWIQHPVHGKGTRLPPPALLRRDGHPLWSGTQLFSSMLPNNLQMWKGKRNPAWPSDSDFLVRDGALLYGRANKSVLGGTAGGLIDVITRDFGAHAIVHYQTDLQRVANQFLVTRGFSVKISDCMLSGEGDAEVKRLVSVATQNAKAVVDCDLPETLRNSGEATVQNCLSKLLMQTGAVARKYLRGDNAIATMIFDSQSKGNSVNLCQITGTVAQTTVEGRRVFFGSRTLTCYAPATRDLEAHGFVESNYCRGLSPTEFFFHAIGGREGLVDTAVKTASTGYIQRRQVKLLEDHKVSYCGCVRNAQDKVLEYVYGGDGFCGSRVERFAFHALLFKDSEIQDSLGVDCGYEEVEELYHCLKLARRSKVSVLNSVMEPMVLLPFNPERKMEVYARYPLASGTPPAAYRSLVLERLREFERKVTLDCPRFCLAAVVRYFFHGGKLFTHNLKEHEIHAIFDDLTRAFEEAFVEPGEMVGALAATSTGEVTTQLTLNTFHLAGVGSRGVTTGIPRLKELLDVTKKTRTPSNCLALCPPYNTSCDFASRLARSLGRTLLGDLVVCTELLEEPDFRTTTVEADKMMVALEAMLTKPTEGSSNWVARLTLSKQECQARDLTPPHLMNLLASRLTDMVHVTASQVNALEWVLRLRLRNVKAMVEHGFSPGQSAACLEQTLCQRVISMLLDTVQVCGHESITSAREREVEIWDEERQENASCWVVDTLGVSLTELGLLPCVDWAKSTTNDLLETMELLGIEATANVLFHEIRTVIAGDSYVDFRHMSQIVAAMTSQGWLKAISRHGMNKKGSGTGPLVRCSFEETADVLMEAALWGERDDSRGVTSSVINGDTARIGTGTFDVMYPDSALPSEAKVSARASKLVKSKVRSAAQKEEPESCMELVDTSLWSFNTTNAQEGVELPFSDIAVVDSSVGATGTQSGAATYAQPPGRKRTEGIFVPSSPKLVSDTQD